MPALQALDIVIKQMETAGLRPRTVTDYIIHVTNYVKPVNIKEIKTQKNKRIAMTPSFQRELKAYIEGKEDYEYLFKSREGVNKPIGRSIGL